MRAVLQRVRGARVVVEGREAGAVGPGLLVLLGVGKNDDRSDAEYLADKVAGIRLFPGPQGDIDTSLLDNPGFGALVVSQFTLFGDCRKGRRPSFTNAAAPERAEELYERFVTALRAAGVPVSTGVFRAMMDVELVNAGPVTILLDSKREF